MQAGDERQGNEEHERVGRDVEAGLHDGIVLEGRALRVWGWHGPVACEGTTGGKEGDFGGDPADEYVDGEVDDEALCCEAEGEASVHDEHTCFDRVDYVEHGLRCVSGYWREKEAAGTCSDTMTILEPWIRAWISEEVKVGKRDGS